MHTTSKSLTHFFDRCILITFRTWHITVSQYQGLTIGQKTCCIQFLLSPVGLTNVLHSSDCCNSPSILQQANNSKYSYLHLCICKMQEQYGDNISSFNSYCRKKDGRTEPKILPEKRLTKYMDYKIDHIRNNLENTLLIAVCRSP